MTIKISKTIRLERAIYRIDRERHLVHGWLVKMDRRAIKYRKLFSDAEWHGRDGALAAARNYRDSVLDAKATKVAATHSPAATPRSTSLAGLDRYCTDNTLHLEKELQHWHWRATWTTSQGQTLHADFSVMEHGDESAFRMALRARRDGMGGVRGMIYTACQTSLRDMPESGPTTATSQPDHDI